MLGMVRILILVILAFYCSFLSGQETEESIDYIDIPDSSVYKPKVPKQKFEKLKFGTDVGMAYTFSSKGYGGPMFTLSPYGNYSLTDKLSISAGLSVGYGNFYNPYYYYSGENSMLPMTRMFIYTTANYQVNDKLMVNGGVYTQIVDVPNRNPDNENSTFNSYGATLGFQYKITPNISFGAQIRVEEPGLYSPYLPVHNPYSGTNSTWW
jgi:hypothetical protein